LELGCGFNSTIMLRMMCRSSGRNLESYDTDKEWARVFDVPTVERWDKWEPKQAHYGVCFIDSSPGEERKFLALKMQGKADFIVMHDHEAGSAAAYYYEHIIPSFKYAETFRAIRPHTLVLSDKEPFGLTKWEQGFFNA
jgi:hypothetical protein